MESQISSTKLQINLFASGGSTFNDQNIRLNSSASLRKLSLAGDSADKRNGRRNVCLGF
jgi:hypothetical protein